MELSALETKAAEESYRSITTVSTLVAGKEQTGYWQGSDGSSRWGIRSRMAHRAIPRATLLGKRVFDLAASTALLVCLAPLFAVVAFAISRSGETVLFSQTRIGRHGKPFKCYKFRSMVPDAEEMLETLLETNSDLRAEWQLSQKLKVDPRITRVGAFIRRTSIDELPQLWNVFRGEMSLVGPRPVLVGQYDSYGRSKKWYSAMKPGITGLWQVTARGDGSFERRKALDCYYVRTYSFRNDLIILLKTINVVLSGRGAS